MVKSLNQFEGWLKIFYVMQWSGVVLFVGTSLLFLFAIPGFAQESGEAQTNKLSPGMELMYSDENVSIAVPKDSKVIHIKPNLTLIEGNTAYMARRFLEVEERLIQLETEQGELSREIEELRMQIKNKW